MRKPAQPGARRRSQAKGAVWERCVSEWLKRLKAAGVLTVFHKLEPTKIGERFVKDAGADFVCCTSSGHYLAIECKATDQNRLAAEWERRTSIAWESLSALGLVTADMLESALLDGMDISTGVHFDRKEAGALLALADYMGSGFVGEHTKTIAMIRRKVPK